MTKERVYISGPVSGRDFDHVRRHFRREERRLQRQGYSTINPLRMRLCVWLAQHGHYRLCLLIELCWLALRADIICMLPEWWESPGAKAERALAKAIGLPILYAQPRKGKKPVPSAAMPSQPHNNNHQQNNNHYGTERISTPGDDNLHARE